MEITVTVPIPDHDLCVIFVDGVYMGHCDFHSQPEHNPNAWCWLFNVELPIKAQHSSKAAECFANKCEECLLMSKDRRCGYKKSPKR